MATVEAQVARIWRRLGFGPTRADVAAGVARGPRRLIEDLLAKPLVPWSAAGFPAGGPTPTPWPGASSS